MKASKFVGSRYMSAEEFNGEPIIGDIVEVGQAPSRSDDGTFRDKLVIGIENLAKPVMLNSGNTTALAEAFGDETDSWLGRKVVVSKGKVKFNRKTVDGLLVRPYGMSAQQPKPEGSVTNG